MRTKSYLFVLLISMLTIVACDNKLDSEKVSRLTYFPDISINGESEVWLVAGAPYTDEGGSATEGGSPIDLHTTFTGTYISTTPSASLNTSIADIYQESYSATNKDGFVGTKTRTIFVAGKGNLVDDISGIYTSTVTRNGVSGAQYTNMSYVIIASLGDGEYQVSDIIGGYYDLGRIYGTAYAGTGYTFTANDIPSNDFTFGGDVGIGAFAGNAHMTGMTVDPDTKTIVFTSTWDGGPYNFIVTLKQVDF